MAKIKVRIKKSGDPEKKKTLPDVTVKGVRKTDKVYGAAEKGGEKTLGEATVSGVRKKPVDKKLEAKKKEERIRMIYSDEYKSKKWDEAAQGQRSGSSKKDVPENVMLNPDYGWDKNEAYHRIHKTPGEKIMVQYSDQEIRPISERYKPNPKADVRSSIKEREDKFDTGWRKWHKENMPEQYQGVYKDSATIKQNK